MLLEHAGPDRRRLDARKRSRCAARWRWPTTSTTRSTSCATARRSRCSTRSRRASSATIRTTGRRVRYDPALANKLLDYFGYKKGADGWRNLPDGKPFTIRYASRPDSLGRQLDELWKKALDGIGVRMEVQKDKFPELLKLERQCKLMMRTASWIADYPDADNFMQLLYGKNIGQNNNGCAKIPEYDKLYEQIDPDAATRPSATGCTTTWRGSSRSMRRGGSIRRRYRNMLIQPRVLGYKKHPILHAEWQYIDVATGPGNVPSAREQGSSGLGVADRVRVQSARSVAGVAARPA